VDVEKILLKCEIRHPDELLCFDGSLLNPEEIRSTMRPGGRILVNAAGLPNLLEGIEGFTVAHIDAVGVAEGLGLGHVINTTVLGAYCRLNTQLDLDRIIDAVTEMVPAKKEINVEAIRRGYESVRLSAPPA